MNTYQFIRLLVGPSLISGIATGVAVAAFFALNFWLFASEDSALHAYFFGANGIFTALTASSHSQSAVFAGAIFNSQAVYYILLASSGSLTGMTVYAILQSLGHAIDRVAADIKEEQGGGMTYRQRVQEIFARLGIRVVVFIAWITYLTATVTIFLPFCSTLLQAGLQDIAAGQLAGSLYLVYGLLLVTAVAHVHVVFARLFFLRPRLFTSDLVA